MEQHEQHNTNYNKVERNFPFINIGFFDKMYDKLVLSVVKKLDSGNIFKFLMVLTFHISSFAMLLGLPIYFLMIAFGEYGFINAGAKGVIAFIIGLPITLFTAWYGYSLWRKRATQLNKEEYKSIISFLLHSYIPKNIIVNGETVALLMFSWAIPSILIGGDLFGAGTGIMAAFYLILGGIGVLIATYLIKEIYFYVLKIILKIWTPLIIFGVAGGLSAGFSSGFSDGDEMVIFGFVSIVTLYIFFMLLKKHVFTQWHDK